MSTLRVEGSLTSKVCSHKGKPRVAETWFSLEVNEKITISTCKENLENSLLSATSGRSRKTHSNKNSVFLKKLGSQDFWCVCVCFLTNTHNSPCMYSFFNHVLTPPQITALNTLPRQLPHHPACSAHPSWGESFRGLSKFYIIWPPLPPDTVTYPFSLS